jgi:hypothetical protein
MFTSVLPAINQSTTPHPAAAGAVSAIRPQPEATAAVARATGPRTAEGKARSSRNAVRHGLLSASKALLPDEDPEDWADFLQDGLRLLAPVGRLEIAVAERIAHLHWRLARVPTVEVEAMQGREDVDNGLWLDDTPLPPGVPETPPLPSLATGPDTKALANIQRYEAHMTRDITRAMQQLRELRAERLAAAEAAPALGARTSCPPRPSPYEPCPAADIHSDPSDPAVPPQAKLPNEVPAAAPSGPGTAVPECCHRKAIENETAPAVSGSSPTAAPYLPLPSYATVVRNLEVQLRARLQRGEPVSPPEDGCDCPSCSMVRSLLAEANSEKCETNSAPVAPNDPTAA